MLLMASASNRDSFDGEGKKKWCNAKVFQRRRQWDWEVNLKNSSIICKDVFSSGSHE